jgi:uncharacterized protein (DUF433 family)
MELNKRGTGMSTIVSQITKQASRCGGEACIRDTRITVWGLEAYRRLGLTDSNILRAIQGLTPTDLDAAWEYVTAHPDEIDRAISDNEAGEPGMVE